MKLARLSAFVSQISAFIAPRRSYSARRFPLQPQQEQAVLAANMADNMAAHHPPDLNLLTATASDLQRMLTAGSTTSRDLVALYARQIAAYDGYLKAMIAVTPAGVLERTAAELDKERAAGRLRGPLHGIPIVVKDNIATVPELGLPTTCGSLALVGSKPRQNAAIIDLLIAA
ncbi:hypothetical protein SCUCBS95973_008903, partial [Sporothrix curviconia]